VLRLPHVCRFLSLTCSTSNAAASVIEELKSFKEGLTVKLDANPGQFCYFFMTSVVIIVRALLLLSGSIAVLHT